MSWKLNLTRTRSPTYLPFIIRGMSHQSFVLHSATKSFNECGCRLRQSALFLSVEANVQLLTMVSWKLHDDNS